MPRYVITQYLLLAFFSCGYRSLSGHHCIFWIEIVSGQLHTTLKYQQFASLEGAHFILFLYVRDERNISGSRGRVVIGLCDCCTSRFSSLSFFIVFFQTANRGIEL